MLLQILRSLESLPTEVTFVWLQWNVHSDVRGDVVTFYSGGAALIPATREVEVVGAFATNMLLTNMFLDEGLVIVLVLRLRSMFGAEQRLSS